jgi:hypothetical protein
MKTFLAFTIGFYLGGTAVVTLIGASFGIPMEEAVIEGLKWPLLASDIIRSMATQDATFYTL